MSDKRITTQDCDRLLGLGDQFLESWADDCSGDDSDKADYHECLADWEKARPLMVAAPDLLASCLELLNCIDTNRDWAEAKRARAAIAKARGERLTIDCAALIATQKGA